MRTDRVSVFRVEMSRGAWVAEAMLGADFKGVVCSDFYGVYTSHDDWLHGYCGAHTIREAKKLAELEPCAETEEFRDRLTAFYVAGKAAAKSGDARARRGARIRLGQIVSSANWVGFPDIVRLQERLDVHKAGVTLFIDRSDVPATNNATERDIRAHARHRAMTGGDWFDRNDACPRETRARDVDDGAPLGERGALVEFDLEAIDLDGFARSLRALEAEAVASLGPDDLAHMVRLERWGRWCTRVGYATAWTVPNPLSMVLLSTGSMARWAIVAHHTMHKGMDRVPGTPERLTSEGFAQGSRRLVDWFDWFVPEAWHHEHNVLHHGYTNEAADPDLVELNVESIRASRLPRALKLLAVGAYALTWKLTYYAPSTLQILQRKRTRRTTRAGTLKDDARGPERYASAFDPRTANGRELWWRSILPYGLGRFVVVPALFAPLGPLAVLSVWMNSVGAEVITNLHTFAIIATNHAGNDLYRFTGSPRDRREWFVRQVLGTVNFGTGGDVRDFLHGFLNYQIEHHLFPDLPPLQLQRIQPRVRAICEEYGVPYRQGSVFGRVSKLVAIAIGDARMKVRGGAARATTTATATPTPLVTRAVRNESLHDPRTCGLVVEQSGVGGGAV